MSYSEEITVSFMSYSEEITVISSVTYKYRKIHNVVKFYGRN